MDLRVVCIKLYLWDPANWKELHPIHKEIADSLNNHWIKTRNLDVAAEWKNSP